MGIYIKTGFGLLAAVLYGVGAFIMLDGAFNTPKYRPGEGPEYLVTTCGAAITAFVAAQLGIAIASGATTGNGGGLVARIDSYAGGGGRLTAAVLIFDLVVLTGFGLVFVWLWSSPGSLAVEAKASALTAAPDYITLQAKAFVALVLAGAAGVGVAATK